MADEDAPLDEERLDEVAEDLDALANRRRLRILQLLTTPRHRKELGAEVEVSRQAASRHVDRLLDRGFIRELEGWRESGPVKEYQVVPERLFALGMGLAELGKLEPEGGPLGDPGRRTTDLDEDSPEPDPPDEDAAALVVANGPEQGASLPLEGSEGRWSLGREDDRDLVLDWDPYVSGRHAEVHLDLEGHAVVDAHSSNGTYVNFSRIPPAERVELSPGDLVKVGRTVLVYRPGAGDGPAGVPG